MSKIIRYAKALLKQLQPISVEDILLIGRGVIGGARINYPKVIHVPGMITLSMPTGRDTNARHRSCVSLTLTTEELARIDLAAKLTGKNRVKFVIDAAVDAAEKVLAMQPTPEDK